MAFNPTGTWIKVTKTYADFATAGTTNNVEIFSLPKGAVIHQVVMKHTAAFTGGSISAYTISVGITGTVTKYSAANDVYTAIGDTVHYPASSTTPVSATPVSFSTTATSVKAYASSTGANLSAATAGSVDIYLYVSVLPF